MAPVSTPATGAPPVCDYEGSCYRTDFWEGQGRDYEGLVERVALRRLLPSSGGLLVDVGAGFGRLADMYVGYGQVVLLDYSQSLLEHARQRLGDDRFLYAAADLYKLPLATHSADAIVMVRVLHHVADVPAALAQLRRALRPEGRLVLEFANKRHLKNIARRLLGRGVDPFDREPYEFAELHYDFHPSWIYQRLAEAGLRVEKRLSVSLFRSRTLKRILPTTLLVKMDACLQRPTARLALGPSIFVDAGPGGGTAPSERVAAQVLSTTDLENRLFRCPSCGHEPLRRQADAMRCRACQARWPIENGIHIFK